MQRPVFPFGFLEVALFFFEFFIFYFYFYFSFLVKFNNTREYSAMWSIPGPEFTYYAVVKRFGHSSTLVPRHNFRLAALHYD